LTDGTVSNVPALIEAKLKASARPFPTGTGNDCTTNTCGAGMLDAHRAIVSVSTAPVVNAGDDQSVAENDIVKLTAKAVDDDYNNGFRYQWRQTAGPTVTLSGATTSLTYFTAPNISADLVFSVTVTDDTGLSASDTVTVTNTGSLKPSKPVLKKQSGGGGSVDIWLLLLGGLIMMQYMMKSYLLTGVTHKRF
jgi:serine protease